MNQRWRVTACGMTVVGLMALSSYPGQPQETGVDRSAPHTGAVEMEVPPGMTFILETGEGSRHFEQPGKTGIEGNATIFVGKLSADQDVDPRETLRQWKGPKRDEALRLRIHRSRVTLTRGQPHYPSHLSIEPLPAASERK